MKYQPLRVLLITGGLSLLTSTVSWAGASEPAPPDASAAADAFRTMGLNIGQQLRQNGVTAKVSMSLVERGINDGLAGKRLLAADQMRLQAFLRSSAEAAAAQNAAAAHDFLARNARAPGVIVTSSGLEYKVIESGDAKASSARPTDLVTVRFRGTLQDGSEFDSSSKPGSASTVQANGVMPAWTQALSLMKPGARWQLFVSPELGFGPITRLDVPGGSLLIYDLDLLSITPSPVSPGATPSIAK